MDGRPFLEDTDCISTELCACVRVCVSTLVHLFVIYLTTLRVAQCVGKGRPQRASHLFLVKVVVVLCTLMKGAVKY